MPSSLVMAAKSLARQGVHECGAIRTEGGAIERGECRKVLGPDPFHGRGRTDLPDGALVLPNIVRRDKTQLLIKRQSVGGKAALAVTGLLERGGGQPPSQPATTHCLIDDDGVERCAGSSERRHEGGSDHPAGFQRDLTFAHGPDHGPVFHPVRPAGRSRQGRRFLKMVRFKRRECDGLGVHGAPGLLEWED